MTSQRRCWRHKCAINFTDLFVGCLLFQMATLEVPFNASNMLTLAKKIVEGSFERISSERGYSNLVSITVDRFHHHFLIFISSWSSSLFDPHHFLILINFWFLWISDLHHSLFFIIFWSSSLSDPHHLFIFRCLTTDSNKRPNILEVCGVIASQMMTFTDQLENERIKIEKKLEKERRRTQRHFHEALRNKLDYQTLFQASQVSRISIFWMLDLKCWFYSGSCW